eukprot:294156_1
MGWSNIWSDDCDSVPQGDWFCKGEGYHCKLPVYDSSRCQNGNCYELCHKNYFERSTPISTYAGHHLRLSLYVHLQDDSDEASSSDQCRIWFAYDDDNFNIDEPDWKCSLPCNGVVTIDIPSSTGRNTLNIALGAYDGEHTHCYFDSLELEYLLPPTPAPTDPPTPSPTKQPTDPTPSPTPSPTATPTKPPSP